MYLDTVVNYTYVHQNVVTHLKRSKTFSFLTHYYSINRNSSYFIQLIYRRIRGYLYDIILNYHNTWLEWADRGNVFAWAIEPFCCWNLRFCSSRIIVWATRDSERLWFVPPVFFPTLLQVSASSASNGDAPLVAKFSLKFW